MQSAVTSQSERASVPTNKPASTIVREAERARKKQPERASATTNKTVSIRARQTERSNKPEQTSECHDEQNSEHQGERSKQQPEQAIAIHTTNKQTSEHQSERVRVK